MIDFSVEPEFQKKLDWMQKFVREECETMDLLWPQMAANFETWRSDARAHLKPLQDQVKAQGLWACHLGPNLGGPGYGQVKLGLMNEIIGRSSWAPTVFGTAAPDTGNAEILALFGTPEQKQRYLGPLMDGDIVSCFSMTEPQGGADPGEFTCKATLVKNDKGEDEWEIEGYKWFSSNAKLATFLLVICVTDPEKVLTERMSMFIVPTDTPGIEILRNVAIAGDVDPENGHHAHIHYNKVRVPLDHMLGERGGGFKVAQARLGGGRIHHAMRTVGICNRAFEMMMERVVSRKTRGRMLGDHQMVQDKIASSIVELEAFRLLVLKTAWIIDEVEAGRMPHGSARNHIGMCKIGLLRIYHDVVGRALEIHGSLGISLDLPLARWYGGHMSLAFADGPTDVHKSQLARAYMKKAKPVEGLFPSEHIPTRTAAAKKRYPNAVDPSVRDPKEAK
jgi:acyl-CoA dehydrogenase